jgi:hypothetical protein
LAGNLHRTTTMALEIRKNSYNTKPLPTGVNTLFIHFPSHIMPKNGFRAKSIDYMISFL